MSVVKLIARTMKHGMMIDSGLKATLFTSILFLGSIPHGTQGFRLQCKYFTQICSLENWKPDEEGYFVLNHVPIFIETLKIINLTIPSIDGKFLSKIRPPLTGIIVESSNAVNTLYVPHNSTIERIKLLDTPINSIDFETNTALQSLTIVNSDLKAIVPSLARLDSLQYLTFRYTDIVHLDLNLFYGMQQLIELSFSTNNIKQLFSSSVASNTTINECLKYFRLKDNKLETINLDLLAPFHVLALVDISRNKIESLSGTLSNPQLEWLFMMHNRITSFSFCTWQGNTNNFTLIAGHNRLTSVPSCLTKFPNTRQIDLSHNRIMQVDMKDFKVLHNLREMNLAGNKMVSLVFGEDILFPKLYVLQLYENCMCHVNGSARIMERMPKLQIWFDRLDEPCTLPCV